MITTKTGKRIFILGEDRVNGLYPPYHGDFIQDKQGKQWKVFCSGSNYSLRGENDAFDYHLEVVNFDLDTFMYWVNSQF